MQACDASGRRPCKCHQPRTAQHKPPGVSILAIDRILEPERPFQSKAPVVLPAQAYARLVHTIVQPLHAGCAAGITPEGVGPLRGRP